MRLRRISLSLMLAALLPALTHAQRPDGPPPGDGGPPGGHMGPPHGGDHGGPMQGPKLGPPGRWWDDIHQARTLNLRPEQIHRMDDIFDANKGTLQTLYGNLQQDEQGLADMSPQDLQDETKIDARIDRVAQARAALEKENAHIQLLIRKELDAQQLVALDRQTDRQTDSRQTDRPVGHMH